MAEEIERKYLVDHEKWQKLSKPAGQHYRQGYILIDPKKTIRVRLTETNGYLTIKGESVGSTRPEYEYEIPMNDAKELLNDFCTTELSKYRRLINYKNRVWEVDEFLDENDGLIIAEIELENEEEDFELPPWVGGEVTGNKKYYNANLVENPFEDWEDEIPDIGGLKFSTDRLLHVPEAILKDIADNMEAGLKCYIHKETQEIIGLPDEDRFPDADLDNEAWQEEIQKLADNPNKYIEIGSMNSSDSFKVMEDFVDLLPNNSTKTRLITALEGHKPFANFNHQIHNSGEYKEQWFKFRMARGVEWVREQLDAIH